MPRNRLGLIPLAAVMLVMAGPAAAGPQAPAKKITYEQAYGMGPREAGLARLDGMVSWLDDENCLVREWDEKAKAMRF